MDIGATMTISNIRYPISNCYMFYISFLKETFYVLTGALVIFTGLELVWPRLVLAYININWILIGWVFIGIVILVVDKSPDPRK